MPKPALFTTAPIDAPINALTIAQALRQAQQAGLERMDAQLLLLHLLGHNSRAWLLTHDDQLLTPAQAQQYAALCAQRLDAVPVAYLTGCKEFFGLPLQVDARVLDPRPDTEILVEWALEHMAPHTPCRVADLGTGSGAIALALQHQRPQASVTAVDVSADALAVAEKIRSALAEPCLSPEGIKLCISASIGIANYPEHAGSEHELLRLGDRAMYEAKSAGGNRVKLFSPEDGAGHSAA